MTDRIVGLVLLVVLGSGCASAPKPPALAPGPCVETRWRLTLDGTAPDRPFSTTRYQWAEGLRTQRHRTVGTQQFVDDYRRVGNVTLVPDQSNGVSIVEVTWADDPAGHVWRVYDDSPEGRLARVDVDGNGLLSRVGNTRYSFRRGASGRVGEVVVHCGVDRRVVWHRDGDGRVARVDVDLGSGMVDSAFENRFDPDGRLVETVGLRRGPGRSTAKVGLAYECAPWTEGGNAVYVQLADADVTEMLEVERTVYTWEKGRLLSRVYSAPDTGRAEFHEYDSAGRRIKTRVDTNGDGRDDETTEYGWDCAQ